MSMSVLAVYSTAVTEHTVLVLTETNLPTIPWVIPVAVRLATYLVLMDSLATTLTNVGKCDLHKLSI